MSATPLIIFLRLPKIPQTITTKEKIKSNLWTRVHTEDEKSVQTLITEAAAAFNNKDYEASVQLYAKALEQTIASHSDDQMHPSTGPLHLAYGRALLQLAISNQSMGIVNESLIDYNLEGDTTDKLIEFGEYEDEEEVDDDDDVAEDVETQETEGDGKEVEEVSSKTDSEKENEPEEAGEEDETALEDDFALAWEVLDIARLIFSKDESKKFMEAEALQEIGDLSMETENFTNAVSDYGKALELLVACDAALRELASINFKLGIALKVQKRSSYEIHQNPHFITDQRINQLICRLLLSSS